MNKEIEQSIKIINKKLDLVIKLLTESSNNNQIQLPAGKLTKEETKDILQDFLINGDGILREVEQGLAVNKEKLYDHFEQSGLSNTEVLRLLDNYGYIYHKGDSRTPLVRYKNTPIRVIVIRKIN